MLGDKLKSLEKLVKENPVFLVTSVSLIYFICRLLLGGKKYLSVSRQEMRVIQNQQVKVGLFPM